MRNFNKRMARTYRVTRLAQIAALASPVRLEILEALTTRPTFSVARIAEQIGRRADGLYYHLKELVRVGLVLPVGRSPGRRRSEALYRAVARRVAVAYEPGSPGNVVRVNEMAAALLRLGARDFRRGFRIGNVVVAGPRRELWVGRATGRLSAAGLARVNRLLARASSTFDSPKAPSDRHLYAVTFLLVPIEPTRKPAQHRRRNRARARGASP
jgi:DNA-binding transcriptional ArsR family regulator